MKTNPFLFLAVVIIFVLGSLFAARLLTPEDSWVCQNGQWVEHGRPSSPKPVNSCPATDDSSNIPKEAFVYFGNNSKDGSQTDCGLVYSLQRNIDSNDAAALLRELFKGPTQEEVRQGYSSFFSDKTKNILVNAKLDGSTAYINLQDIRPLIPNASTSCGSAQFLSEIETTLRQNLGVDKVFLAINGNPQTFYDWIQIGCQPETNNCNPAPFLN